MSRLFYSEINIFGILILTLVIIKMLKSLDLRKSQMLFFRVLIDCIILFLMDTIWVLVEGGTTEASLILNYVSNGLYFIFSGVLGYHWLIYSETILETDISKDKKKEHLCMIPLIILMLLTVSSYWTGWIYYIDSDMVYHRGTLHILQIIIGIGYLVVASVRALMYALKKENYINRSQYLTLTSFGLFPLVASVLQIFWGQLPLLAVGITLSVLNIFYDFQQQLISQDVLTQTNNRRSMVRYLMNKMAVYKEDKHLYLMFLNIKEFKRINEIFGREEGDNALIYVAEVLKKLCTENGYYLARYGGDEFVLVCEDEEPIDMALLSRSIQKEVEAMVAKKQYSLTFHTGYAEYVKAITTVKEFINLTYAQIRQKRAV